MRWITPLEVEQMAHTTEAAFELRPDGPRQIGIQLIGPKVCQEAKHNDACCLTDSDAQANVGITNGEPGTPARRSTVARSQIRVAFWPIVGDDRAVRVGPRV